jgi:hypothetical protein
MKQKLGTLSLLVAIFVLGLSVSVVPRTNALITPPGPGSGSAGVEGTIPSPAPTQAATIVSPANGASFGTIPITVSGLCKTGLLVKIFSNNIFVGSVMCQGGSYSIQVSLFSGKNELVARVFDALDQQGPDSNKVTVTYNDAQFSSFGTHVLLTSQFARRGAAPDQKLDWPVILSGGIGPYAISSDWGDDKAADLRSESFPGVITLAHTYTTAGTYNVIFKATDHNKTEAYLQVVAVISGNTSGNESGGKDNNEVVTRTQILWQPAAALLIFVFISFWLGRRYELSALRKRIEQDWRS